jgi:hypothetical protein
VKHALHAIPGEYLEPRKAGRKSEKAQHSDTPILPPAALRVALARIATRSVAGLGIRAGQHSARKANDV